MPTDPGRILDLLVAAVQRQQANYVELQSAVEGLADHLRARWESPAAPEAGNDAQETQGMDLFVAAQMRALQRVQKTEQHIAALRERLAEALGIDEVTVSALQAALSSRARTDAGGGGGIAAGQRIDEGRVDELARILRTVLAMAEHIRETTEANEARIRAAIKSVRGRMDEVRLGQSAARAYGDVAKGFERPSRYLDKRE